MKTILIPFVTILLILSVGTVAYHYMEGWEYIDSLYFSTIALTTGISSGFYPTKDISKLFTVFYIIGGLGTVLFELTQIGRPQLEKHLTKAINGVRKIGNGSER